MASNHMKKYSRSLPLGKCKSKPQDITPHSQGWLKSKTQNERLKSMLDDIEVNVQTVVDYMEQTVVQDMKNSKDWNSNTQAQVMRESVDRILDSILSSTKKTLEDNQIDITDYIASHVEAYIQRKKTAV